MMRLCYIILAHNNLVNVKRIIEMLSGEGIGFVVHVDKKCCENIEILRTIKDVTLAGIRHDVLWGDISMVDAVIEAARQAISDDRKFDYFILLSGSDVPVKRAAYIRKYLEAHNLSNFMIGSQIPSPTVGWLEGGRRRLECYAVRLSERDIATIEPRRFDYGNFRQIVKTIVRGNCSQFFSVMQIFLFAEKKKISEKSQTIWW